MEAYIEKFKVSSVPNVLVHYFHLLTLLETVDGMYKLHTRQFV